MFNPSTVITQEISYLQLRNPHLYVSCMDDKAVFPDQASKFWSWESPKTYQFYLVTCIVSCRKITALNSAFREVWWRSLRKNEQNRSSQHVIHRQKIVRKSLQIIHTTFESRHEVSQNLVRMMILAKPTRPTSWFKLEPLYICLSCWRSPSQKGHQRRIAR